MENEIKKRHRAAVANAFTRLADELKIGAQRMQMIADAHSSENEADAANMLRMLDGDPHIAMLRMAELEVDKTVRAYQQLLERYEQEQESNAV